MSDQSPNAKDFLGVGLAFPLGVGKEGQVSMNKFEDQVRQSILLILRTALGERVMRPDFGAGLSTMVFEPVSTATMELVKKRVTDALVRFEPRITVLKVDVNTDVVEGNFLQINVQYQIRRTDSIFNLVYPFYLERGGA